MPEDDGLRLDTPYILQDGHALRVYLYPAGQNGDVIVSDGGFATEQIEILSPAPSSLSRHYGAVDRIARKLGLGWDVDGRFRESSVERAAQRLATLARAVDRSLTLVQPRVDRAVSKLTRKLGENLKGLGLDWRGPSNAHSGQANQRSDSSHCRNRRRSNYCRSNSSTLH